MNPLDLGSLTSQICTILGQPESTMLISRVDYRSDFNSIPTVKVDLIMRGVPMNLMENINLASKLGLIRDISVTMEQDVQDIIFHNGSIVNAPGPTQTRVSLTMFNMDVPPMRRANRVTAEDIAYEALEEKSGGYWVEQVDRMNREDARRQHFELLGEEG